MAEANELATDDAVLASKAAAEVIELAEDASTIVLSCCASTIILVAELAALDAAANASLA